MTTKWASCSAPIIRLPLSTLGETEAVLMEPWTVEVRGHVIVLASHSATTDGASIPRFLWRICGHPLQAPRVYAALVHDFLYRRGWALYHITRKEADEIYYALLRHFGISVWSASIEYTTLRLFGWRHYKGTEK